MYADARQREAAMLDRCALAARNASAVTASGAAEANVFRVAAMVMQSRYPAEARSLRTVSDRYFAVHPRDLKSVADVVQAKHVASLPRLRDMLTRKLMGR